MSQLDAEADPVRRDQPVVTLYLKAHEYAQLGKRPDVGR